MFSSGSILMGARCLKKVHSWLILELHYEGKGVLHDALDLQIIDQEQNNLCTPDFSIKEKYGRTSFNYYQIII